MEQIYLDKMNKLGYNQLVCDIFDNWENVKDEILLPERKEGTGNGTIHVFLGTADSQLQKEFISYYQAVENGEDPSTGAIVVKHYFLASNVLSMLGHVCQYYYSKRQDSSDKVKTILSLLSSYPSVDGLLETTSLFKLSTGSNKLRPYFKQFDANGVFTKLIRQLLLPNSGYKISLYKNSKGEYAAFWLIGFDWQTNFEANSNKSLFSEKQMNEDFEFPRQQIFYGAPGTGKSNTIKKQTAQAEKKGRVFRTTFHPDSDYSTFVGCYKPKMEESTNKGGRAILDYEAMVDKFKEYIDATNKNITQASVLFGHDFHDSIVKMLATTTHKIPDLVADAYKSGTTYDSSVRAGMRVYEEKPQSGNEQIVYKFVPQAFTNAYVKAWNTTENVYLIIEEINRGNCAQIFGDLFQLLDRDDNGKSEYPIDADTDLMIYLSNELANSTRDDFPEDVKEGKKLVLPPNLYIWATMNTSDQSLFPVDSAFKRRWDWVYIPIAKSNEDEFFIKVDDKCYDWWTFISQMNSVVESVTSSEDKQLGYYFCKPDEGIFISAKRFVSKVLFYLWNDVFKNYGFDATLDGNKVFACKDGNGKDAVMTFTSFFEKNGNPNLKQIEQLMKNLGIDPEENIPPTTATTNGPKPKRNYDKFVIEGETVEHPKYEIASEVVRKYIKNNDGKTAQEVADYWKDLMKDKVGIPNFIMTKVEYDNQKSKTAKSKSNEIECGDGEFVYVTTHLWGDDFDYISKFEEAVNNKTDLGIKIQRVPKD